MHAHTLSGSSALDEAVPSAPSGNPPARKKLSPAAGSRPHQPTFVKIFLVIVLVYFFLVSIGLMEVAFKGFGKQFAENLMATTANPFVGLVIGVLATSLVQSSSTTTSMAVGMVGAGVLSIRHTIPIIMGANIGTTVTNLIVSLGHMHRREEFRRAIAGSSVHDFFNLLCVIVLFPLEMTTHFLEKTASLASGLFLDFGGITFTSPVKAATKPVVQTIHAGLRDYAALPPRGCYILMLVLSIMILFVCLYFIVKVMRSLVIRKAENAFDGAAMERAGVRAIFIGLFFTILVQSSSITTSLLVPLVAGGLITVEAAFPITLGANIGTTTTAILASFATGNLAAITVAFVHFLFNVIGVFVFYPIRFMRSIPIRMAKGLGDLAFRKRRYAVLYVLFAFFILPALLVFVYEWFKS